GLTTGATSLGVDAVGTWTILVCLRSATGALLRVDTTSLDVNPGPEVDNVAFRIKGFGAVPQVDTGPMSRATTNALLLSCGHRQWQGDGPYFELADRRGALLVFRADRIGGIEWFPVEDGFPCDRLEPLDPNGATCEIFRVRRSGTFQVNFD